MKKPGGHGPISQTLEHHQPILEKCITQSISLNSGEGVKVIVNFTLLANGKVKNPSIERMSAPDPDFGECLLKKLRKLSFPRPESGQDEPIRYPLIFTQARE